MKSDFADITASYLYDSFIENEDENAKYYKEVILSGMKIADLGISDIKVEKSKMKIPTDFLNRLKEDSKEEVIDTLKDKELLKTTFIHKLEDKSTYALPFAEESIGTQDYFNLLGPWFDALVNGYTLFIDELETSLHPLLVNKLLEFVNNEKINNKGAQIIFTSHETTLLNSDLLRRDQIWFTEKDNNGATSLYSLLEYKPRKGEAIQKGYLSGRYGAIPILEDFEIYDN